MAVERSRGPISVRRLCGIALVLLVQAAPGLPVQVRAADAAPPALLLAERYRDDIDV